MRFPLATLAFIVISFVFFVCWAVSSYLVGTTANVFKNINGPTDASYLNLLTLLPTAFGVICAIFFITGVVLYFVMESLSDEPETYWRY